MIRKPPPWNPEDVFGGAELHEGSCCRCCDDWCPADDIAAAPPLYVTRDGYITDARIAIRADLIDATGHDVIEMKATLPAAPPTKPGESTATLHIGRVQRLRAIGIEICAGDDEARSIQPLYLGGEHVGWLAIALGAPTLAELARIEHDLDVIRERGDILPALKHLTRESTANSPEQVLHMIRAAVEEIRFLDASEVEA